MKWMEEDKSHFEIKKELQKFLSENDYILNLVGAENESALLLVAEHFANWNGMQHVKEELTGGEKDLGWRSVKESLPPIDEEVIVLTDVIHGKIVPGAHMICYAHRPNPKGWDGKNIETGEVKHHDVVTYDGWNIPGVTHWMYCPKLEEE